jgi:hypothetical protein
MDVKGWRKIAKDKNVWKLVLEEARVLHGQFSRWRNSVHHYTARIWIL